jgi:Glycosyltransferase family 17
LKFIIVEDNKTFMRAPKGELAFGDHRAEFRDYEDKIIYIFLGDTEVGLLDLC